MIKLRFQSKGFTLLESLVAVAILALATSGPLYAANRAIVAAEISSNRLTASYLAQEGIEEIRKMRDDAYLNLYKNTIPRNTSNAWPNFLSNISACASANGCTLDPWISTVTTCGGSPCNTHLYIEDSTRRYKPQSGPVAGYTKTAYIRSIMVSPVLGSPKEEKITSRIDWTFRSTAYSVTINGHLTPWLP